MSTGNTNIFLGKRREKHIKYYVKSHMFICFQFSHRINDQLKENNFLPENWNKKKKKKRGKGNLKQKPAKKQNKSRRLTKPKINNFCFLKSFFIWSITVVHEAKNINIYYIVSLLSKDNLFLFITIGSLVFLFSFSHTLRKFICRWACKRC